MYSFIVCATKKGSGRVLALPESFAVNTTKQSLFDIPPRERVKGDIRHAEHRHRDIAQREGERGVHG